MTPDDTPDDAPGEAAGAGGGAVEREAAAVTGRDDVAVLVIEARPELGATLLRYAADGTPRPDIWYGSADEARMCAARDYPGGVGPWRPLPPDVVDPVRFALGDSAPG